MLAPGSNRLAELKDGAGVVSRGFTHTPGGDLASVTRAGAPTLTYSYDARGRLSSVLSGTAQIASYAYDWREQRVAASSTEVGSRHYLYAEDSQLLAEHDAATGALIREYVWLDTMPLAMVTGPAATPSYTWITTGNLNEPLLLTNAAGQVTASTTRDPWGNPILLVGGQPLDLGYPGQWPIPPPACSKTGTATTIQRWGGTSKPTRSASAASAGVDYHPRSDVVHCDVFEGVQDVICRWSVITWAAFLDQFQTSILRQSTGDWGALRYFPGADGSRVPWWRSARRSG